MVILGLTGSIGMGKSTAAGMFRELRIPVHDSDAEVHRLMMPGGGAVEPVEQAFPDVVAAGGINPGYYSPGDISGHVIRVVRLDSKL